MAEQSQLSDIIRHTTRVPYQYFQAESQVKLRKHCPNRIFVLPVYFREAQAVNLSATIEIGHEFLNIVASIDPVSEVENTTGRGPGSVRTF